MVNLRYHIVSLTAVFLALGIGLTLGSSFLDRVTVETLENQLSGLQGQISDTRTENRDLSQALATTRDRDRAFADLLDERLVAGRLEGVPVLVLATEGTEEAWVDATLTVLASSGAEVLGAWWLTDRFDLESDDARVTDLAGALGLTTSARERLLRSATVRLADVLLDGAEVPPGPDEDAAAADAEAETPGDDVADDDVASLDPDSEDGTDGEADLVAALRSAGFLEHQRLANDDGPVGLAAAGMRYVVVSAGADSGGSVGFLDGLVRELTRTGPVPLVLAQGTVSDAPAGSEEEDRSRTTLVGTARADEDLTGRLSTVDSLDLSHGLVALVLAVEDLGAGLTGHYGVTGSAMRLLPAPAGEP